MPVKTLTATCSHSEAKKYSIRFYCDKPEEGPPAFESLYLSKLALALAGVAKPSKITVTIELEA
jgi:hypothetical protein